MYAHVGYHHYISSSVLLSLTAIIFCNGPEDHMGCSNSHTRVQWPSNPPVVILCRSLKCDQDLSHGFYTILNKPPKSITTALAALNMSCQVWKGSSCASYSASHKSQPHLAESHQRSARIGSVWIMVKTCWNKGVNSGKATLHRLHPDLANSLKDLAGTFRDGAGSKNSSSAFRFISFHRWDSTGFANYSR